MRLNGLLCARFKLKDVPKNYANLPERYVKKQTQFVQWETPKMPQYQRRIVRWRKFAYHQMEEPWTQEFQKRNEPGRFQPKIYVEPLRMFPVFIGDYAEILTGRDKGKQGIVNFVNKYRNWVCLEQLNLGYKIEGKTADHPGMVLTECLPLLYNVEVRLVDPSDKLPTEIEIRYDEHGSQVRVSKRTGRIIPIPGEAIETHDYRVAELYVEQDKDTLADDLKEVTFTPEAKTFEMDIMDQMSIKEDRVPYKMFWY